MTRALPATCAIALAACSAHEPPASPADTSPAEPAPAEPAPSPAPAEPVLVGPVTRDAIEAALPRWLAAREAATVDEEAARALAKVPPGAEVTVVLGTWCGDSRREVPRLWKALDTAGPPPPFAITLLGVDRSKQGPGVDTAALGVRYVPTVIVRRGGAEVGRIVESAPEGIERALLELLAGRRSGVISGRADVGAAPAR